MEWGKKKYMFTRLKRRRFHFQFLFRMNIAQFKDIEFTIPWHVKDLADVSTF